MTKIKTKEGNMKMKTNNITDERKNHYLNTLEWVGKTYPEDKLGNIYDITNVYVDRFWGDDDCENRLEDEYDKLFLWAISTLYEKKGRYLGEKKVA